MVELNDDEFMAVKDFITVSLRDKVDWDSADEEFKNEYTDVLQIVNAFGEEQQQGSEGNNAMAEQFAPT